MPAFGRDAILKEREIDDLTGYVLHLSRRPADAGTIRRGGKLFADNCASCHGARGAGDRQFGAPNLTDRDWLYGGSAEEVREQIWNGRGGVMPTWGDKLSPETIKALAVYVHSLGGGE
jgi:cytochrome c oxidase cbb3-type subunit 3